MIFVPMVKRNRNADEIPRVVPNWDDAIEGEHWSKDKGKKDPFACLVSVNNRRCPYGPLKYKFHINSHMKIYHKLDIGKSKHGPKDDENGKSTKKHNKKSTKNPN